MPMARIKGVDPESTNGYVRKVLEAQAKLWGAPLANHLVYARRPVLFKAVRAMWGAIDRDSLLGPTLVALVNRRVAALNGCEF
jgi:alkylhydroperoxidase family enzyme